jgi:dihydropyrimidine dehydrogenase (NAD+) subunit PreA
MHHGFRIVEDMIDGLNNYLDEKGIASVMGIVGRSVSTYQDWGNLNLNYKIVARIHEETCIHCNKCHIACEDTSHQCIDIVWDDPTGKERLVVREDDCVGCNLCAIVCPVEGTIEMVEIDTGQPPLTWNQRQAALAAGGSCEA